MKSSSLGTNSNVTIYVKDKRGKIIRKSHIHNKATVILAEGILRFLQGDFTPSQTPNTGITKSYNAQEALRYLPYEIRVGTIGEVLNNRNYDPNDPTSPKPVLNSIDSSLFIKPTFSETKLQEEIEVLNPIYRPTWDKRVITFSSTDIVSYGDTNNSLGLRLYAFIPSGSLVGFKDTSIPPNFIPYVDAIVDPNNPGHGWSYWNNSIDEWEAIFTEIGLYSASGEMLARVLLDGKINLTFDDNSQIESLTYTDPDYDNNPILQSETTSVIVEWQIGLVSIGQNDKSYTLTFYSPDQSESFTQETDLNGSIKLPLIPFDSPEAGLLPYGWKDLESGIAYPENTTITVDSDKSYLALFRGGVPKVQVESTFNFTEYYNNYSFTTEVNDITP